MVQFLQRSLENLDTFEQIVHPARQLPPNEKAALARMLLDKPVSGNFASKEIESVWIEEANRYYQAYRPGEISSSPSEEVFARVRVFMGR